MALTDTMVDLETLATTPDALVLTLGAVRFDPFADDSKKPEYKTMYLRIDLDSSTALGCVTNDDTIHWWSQQSQEAQDEAFSEEDRIPIEDAMAQFYKFAWGSKRVWSHGATFDIVILEHIYRKLGKAPPWKFWESRCSRTLFDIGINPDKPAITAHNALSDAIAQALGVQKVFRTLKSSTTSAGEYIQPFARER